MALGVLSPVTGEEEPKPDAKKQALADLLGKLKEKRDRQGNQVYKLEFERTGFNKGIATGICREEWELQIDWKTGKFRDSGWTGCMAQPYEIIRIYDGEKIKTQYRDVTKEGKPTGDGSWKYGLVTGRMNSAVFQREYWPVFLHRGMIPDLHEMFYPGHLVFEPDAEKFFVQGEVMRDGRKCISLKTFPENPTTPIQYEYILDPGKDYAVVGWWYYKGGKPSMSLDIKVVAGKQAGQWVLSEWTSVSWNSDATTAGTAKVKVTSFAEEVPVGEKNAYDVVAPEGSKVVRNHLTLPEGKQDQKNDRYEYEVKDGKLIQISGPSEALNWVWRNWHWLALVVAGTATALLMRRRWRSSGRESVSPTGK
jgi:hypothetical protein